MLTIASFQTRGICYLPTPVTGPGSVGAWGKEGPGLLRVAPEVGLALYPHS